MKELFKRHYQAIVKRGLIHDKVNIHDFFLKVTEEMQELSNAIYENDNIEQEAIDLMMTTVNLCTWLGIDIEKELLKNTEIQEKRANEKHPINKNTSDNISH